MRHFDYPNNNFAYWLWQERLEWETMPEDNRKVIGNGGKLKEIRDDVDRVKHSYAVPYITERE